MNYGYDRCDKGWRKEKVNELVTELTKLASQYKPIIEYSNYTPYIEVNGLFEGVRIRRITHLSETDRRELVKKADDIYIRVMKVR